MNNSSSSLHRLTFGQRFDRLLGNSRFWILALVVTASVLIAGFIQLYVPGTSLQTIRIEQSFGFISLALLYGAVLASPLTKAFPGMPLKAAYLHARRAIGVSAFYFAFLHVWISFFQQLGGFGGMRYYDARYELSLLGGILALGILFILTATSLDWAVRVMHFKNWKLLHRLVYLGCVAVMVHIILIGPHYAGVSALSVVTYMAAVLLVVLEVRRLWLFVRHKVLRNRS